MGQSVRIYRPGFIDKYDHVTSWNKDLLSQVTWLGKKTGDFFHFLIPAYISVKMISESWMCPSEGGDKAFIYISRDHMINESCDSVGEIPST